MELDGEQQLVLTVLESARELLARAPIAAAAGPPRDLAPASGDDSRSDESSLHGPLARLVSALESLAALSAAHAAGVREVAEARVELLRAAGSEEEGGALSGHVLEFVAGASPLLVEAMLSPAPTIGIAPWPEEGPREAAAAPARPPPPSPGSVAPPRLSLRGLASRARVGTAAARSRARATAGGLARRARAGGRSCGSIVRSRTLHAAHCMRAVAQAGAKRSLAGVERGRAVIKGAGSWVGAWAGRKVESLQLRWNVRSHEDDLNRLLLILASARTIRADHLRARWRAGGFHYDPRANPPNKRALRHLPYGSLEDAV